MADHTTIDLQCFNGPEASLITYFELKNIDKFRASLASGTDAETLDKKVFLSVFDKVCQTPNSNEYISACIKYGCDVNKLNTELRKRPINFAAESQDVENILALLKHPEVNINNQYDEQTPIYQLAKSIKTQNFQNVFECLKLLIDKGADINIPDGRGITPIITLTKSRAEGIEEVLKYFLKNKKIDIDSYRDGEAREILSEDFPNLQLPEMKETKVDFNYLLSLLSENLPEKFVQALEEYMRTANDNDKNNLLSENNGEVTLLQRAINRGLSICVRSLINYGAQVNYTPTQTNSPIQISCLEGYWEILEILLNHPDIKLKGLKNPLLIILVKNIGETSSKKTCNYEKCFKILLNDARIDVNEKDFSGSTALHYAVRFKNDEATLELLKKSSFIGTKNIFNDLPISDIKPKILEKYFDSCIKTNGKRPGDDNLQIMFDYSCFVPTIFREPISKKAFLNCSEEMAPIEYMTKSNELRYLIKHPLISSYLWLKWHRLGCIFYTNFILFSFFCLSMILYIVFCYGKDVNDDIAILLRTLCMIGGIYVLGREIVQFIMSPINYLKNRENYIEIALIIVTVLVLLANGFTETNRRMLGAIAILLAGAEFSMLVGTLPILTITTHMVMLKTVAMSFLKTLILYSIILVSFALCFNSLFAVGPKQIEVDPKIPTETPAAEEDEFSSFNNPGTAILKTIVMLTGEFDAGSINFNLNFSSYFIFSLFLFVSIVLFNLLNGLAVSDTHAIKSEAELTGFISRANILTRYEVVIMGKTTNLWSGIASNVPCIRSISTNLISLFPKFLPMHSIVLTPNNRNKVHILRSQLERVDSKDSLDSLMGDSDLIALKSPLQPLACCFGMERCSRMDGKIVRYARTVLENCDRAIEEEKIKEEIDKRMEKIEKNVALIEGMVREILNR